MKQLLPASTGWVIVLLAMSMQALLTSAIAIEPPDRFTFPMTARWPVVTVPRGSFRITGIVDPKAAKGGVVALHSFVTLDPGADNGIAAPEDTGVFLAYTDEALYVGFVVEMPEGVFPRISVSEGRDVGFDDDAFEIFLVTGDHDGEQFHIGGTAGGVTWERRLDRPGGWGAWNPHIQYAVHVNRYEARRGSYLWEGQFKIPWSELGVDPPKEGDVWRANFLANRRSPRHRLDAWSYWKHWRDKTGYGRLVFGGQRLFFSYGKGGGSSLSDRAFAVQIGVRSPQPELGLRRAEWSYALYWRDSGTAAGQLFYRQLQTIQDQTSGTGALLVRLEQDVQRLLSTYQFQIGLTKPKTFAVPAVKPKDPIGAEPIIKTKDPVIANIRVDKEGDYLFTYYVRDITSPDAPLVIAGGVLPLRIQTGLQGMLWPYLLTRQSVVLAADLRALSEERKRGARLHGWVARTGEHEVLAQATADYGGGPHQDVEVSVAGLPVGHYEARLRLLDGAEHVLSESPPLAFPRPEEPDWWVNRDKYGMQPEVPAPWTPIEWLDGTAKVWGRQVAFGQSPLPEKILNQGHDILAGPLDLELKVDGVLQSWQKRSAKLVEQRPGHVLFETNQEAAGVRAKGQTRFEFDGFALVDLWIEPVSDPAQIESLDLVIPIKAEYAGFLTNYTKAPGPGGSVGRYVGRTPNHYESPVMITTWLGRDDVGGLEWSCESSNGWALARPDRAIEVDRRGETVEARFHFIDHPIILDRTIGGRHIRFGLLATPTKPISVDQRRMRIESGGYPPPVPGEPRFHADKWDSQPGTEESLRAWKELFGAVDVLAMPNAGWGVSEYQAWNTPVTDPQLQRLRQAQTRIMREAGVRGLWYGGWAVRRDSPLWDPWGKEMLKWPLEPSIWGQYMPSYGSPYLEFMVGSFALHARELGIQGIRFDTVMPWSSANPYLGETWSAADGNTYGSYNLFRQRELLKRLYRIFHGGEVNDGMLYLPLAGPPIMAMESFVDIREIGEGFYQKAPSLREGYPQDLVRVWMTERPYGFVAAVNNIKPQSLLLPLQRVGGLLAAGADPRFSVRPGALDIKHNGNTIRVAARIWEAWSWIDRSTAQWWPHWTNATLIGASGPGEHYVSFFLRPGRRILLVVANYEHSSQQVILELNHEALGFPQDARLEAQDAVTLEAVPMEDNALRLSIEPELFRLIKIGPAAELHGPNLDPKHALAKRGPQ